jgi:DNA-binding response OmpR family regulator
LADTGHAKKKILLVDDSLTTLMMHRMALSKGSFDIITARSGVDAVTMAIAERPDLIVMDVVMPELSGFEACARLRATEATKLTPIILVTTRGDVESVTTGFASGCTDYLTKPVNPTELLVKVKLHLRS